MPDDCWYVCGAKGYNVINETGNGEGQTALMFACGESVSDVRAHLQGVIAKRCPLPPIGKSPPEEVAAHPADVIRLYNALRQADAAATAAQREIAIRDAVQSMQERNITEDSAVTTICCGTYEVAAKFGDPATSRDFARLKCETEFISTAPADH